MSIHLAIFGKPRYLGLLDMEAPFPPRGTWLVVETMRGSETALLGGPLSKEQEARYRASCSDDSSDGQVKGGEPILQEISFTRLASGDDLAMAASEREEENEVLVKARVLLRNHNLSMKLVDVEYLLDKKKLFFYFTSEQRVDFRAYVRDLAKEFKTRIELRQIGVRDEAKAVKGIAPCGRECCCSYWLHKFTPICIKMVKEQNLALNPTKISGICGRLMCCMSYEHHLYGVLWKALPNPGAKLRTPSGNYVVEGVELSTDAVRLRRPDGGNIIVKVGDFARFKETVMEGREWEEPSVVRKPPFESGRFLEGRSFRDAVAGKAGRSFSEETSRSSRKKTAETGGKEGQVDSGQSRTEKKRQEQDKKVSAAIGREKAEPEKKIAESVPEGAPKGNKKKRRRRKPQGASNQERRQEKTEVKETGPVPSAEGNTAAKTESKPAPTDKGEQTTKRSSGSRRRRSGKGGNKKPQEGRPEQNPQPRGPRDESGGKSDQQNKQRNRPPQKEKEQNRETPNRDQ